ncbi:MAG: TIR domain-containing protein [Prochloraceae cyanobacterium]
MPLDGFKQYKPKNLEAHLARERELLKLFKFVRRKNESPQIREESSQDLEGENAEIAKYQEESARLKPQLEQSPSTPLQKRETQLRQSSNQPKSTTASSLPSNNQGKDEATRSAPRQGRQIFLAHTHEDSEEVLKLYELLTQQGYQPWLNKFDLIPGQSWRIEIPRAIENSDILIACLSKKSLKKQRYVPTELQLAFHEYAKRPSGSIYLILLKLDNCKPPDFQLPELGINLRELQWLDYWRADGFENLIAFIKFFVVEYFG